MTQSQRRGFTLIELIVSLAITAVIAYFVFSFATSIARLWRSTEGSVSTELDVQIALDRIAMDLESALFFEKGDAMFAVSAIAHSNADAAKGEVDRKLSGRWDPPNLQGAGRLPSEHFFPESHQYGWAGSWLRFFSAVPSVNAVGYQIIREEPFSGFGRHYYTLFRTVVRHDLTIANRLNIQDPRYSEGSANLSDTSVDPACIARPWLQSVFLEDVVDFGVRLYVYDRQLGASDDSPAGLRLIYPSTDNETLSAQERSHFASTFDSTNRDIQYPDVVEVFIRVLDDVGSELLRESEDVRVDAAYSEIVEKHGRLYSRMVEVAR